MEAYMRTFFFYWISLLAFSPTCLTASDFPQAVWEWKGPVEKVGRWNQLVDDDTRLILDQTGHAAVYDVATRDVILNYKRTTGFLHRDRRRMSIVAGEGFITYDLRDGQPLRPRFPIPNASLRIIDESKDGKLLMVADQGYLAVYSLAEERIIGTIPSSNERKTAFFDDPGYEVVQGQEWVSGDGGGTRIIRRLERFSGVNWNERETLDDMRAGSAVRVGDGLMYTSAFGVTSTTLPLKQYAPPATRFENLPSGRKLGITIDYRIGVRVAVYDAKINVIREQQTWSTPETSFFAYEASENEIVFAFRDLQVRWDLRDGSFDTIKVEPWPKITDEWSRMSHRYVSFRDDVHGVTFYDLDKGAYWKIFQLNGLPIKVLRSPYQPFNVKSGSTFHKVDLRNGYIRDSRMWIPPANSDLYSASEDRWYSRPLSIQVKGTRTFDESDEISYYEHIRSIVDVAVSSKNQELYTGDILGRVIVRGLKDGRAHAMALYPVVGNSYKLYRMALRHSDSTLVVLWKHHDSLFVHQRSLSDTSRWTEKYLGKPPAFRKSTDESPFHSLVVNDKYGYTLAALRTHPKIYIVNDTGKATSFTIKDTAVAACLIEGGERVAIAGNGRNVYIYDHRTDTLRQYPIPYSLGIGQISDIDYLPEHNLLVMVTGRDVTTEIGVVILEIPSGKFAAKQYDEQVRLLHNGRHFARFVTEYTGAIELIDPSTWKPIDDQWLTELLPRGKEALPSWLFRRFVPSADTSVLALFTWETKSAIVTINGDIRRIDRIMNAESEGEPVLRMDGEDKWLIFEGKSSTHVYHPSLFTKATILPPASKVTNRISGAGLYAVQAPFDKTVLTRTPVYSFASNLAVDEYGTWSYQDAPKVKYLNDTCKAVIPTGTDQQLIIIDNHDRVILRSGNDPLDRTVLPIKSTITSYAVTSPNKRTIALIDVDRLTLIDAPSRSIVATYELSSPLPSFAWDMDSEHAYISHDKGLFGKYTFTGVVGIKDDAHARSNTCDQEPHMNMEGTSVTITSRGARSIDRIWIYSVTGEIIGMHEGGNTMIRFQLPPVAHQVLFIRVQEADCEYVRPLMIAR